MKKRWWWIVYTNDKGGRGSTKNVKVKHRLRAIRKYAWITKSSRIKALFYRRKTNPNIEEKKNLRTSRNRQTSLQVPILIKQPPPSLNTSKLRILPRLIKVLKEEISRPVRVRLTNKRIQECLQVRYTGRWSPVRLVSSIWRLGGPTCLGDVHLGVVRKSFCLCDICILEECVCPAGSVVNSRVSEPWVDVCHL